MTRRLRRHFRDFAEGLIYGFGPEVAGVIIALVGLSLFFLVVMALSPMGPFYTEDTTP